MKHRIRRLCALAGAFFLSALCAQPVSAAEGRLYNQYDPYWDTVMMYSITGTKNTMYASACGIFSFCNALYGLNSTEIDAIEFAEWACANGSYRPGNGGTYKDILYKYVQEDWGERANFILTDTFDGDVRDSRLIAHLKAGGVAVTHVYGHFIAITGYDEANGLYHVIESACSKNRGLAGDSWVTASKLMSGRTNADWFALLVNTKAPEHALVTTDYLHSVGSQIDFRLESDIKGSFGLAVSNPAGERVGTYYSHQAALSCVQHIFASVTEAGIHSCYTTSYNEYGFRNSSSFRFLVYDTKPQKALLSCESPMTAHTAEPTPLIVKGDLAESYTVQITDEDGVTVVNDLQNTELSEWSGDTHVYSWIPEEPGSYTACVIMHNDYGDLESNTIDLYAAGDVTVQLDATGGKPFRESVPAPYAGSYGVLPEAKRLWYTFDGWYTQAEGGDPVLPDTTVTNRHTHSVYAHWNPLPQGDLNADRSTDLCDAVLLSRILFEDSSVRELENYSDMLEYADADRDGYISMQDLTFVLSLLFEEQTITPD